MNTTTDRQEPQDGCTHRRCIADATRMCILELGRFVAVFHGQIAGDSRYVSLAPEKIRPSLFDRLDGFDNGVSRKRCRFRTNSENARAGCTVFLQTCAEVLDKRIESFATLEATKAHFARNGTKNLKGRGERG